MEPFLGQIMMFGGNFAPRGWAFCDGQLMSIAQYSALFSILGTTYGGDGRTTFALPDLRGRAPIHMGHGPGLTQRSFGSQSGSETTTLNVTNMPSHTHGASFTETSAQIAAHEGPGNKSEPNPGNVLAEIANGYRAGEANTTIDGGQITGNVTVSPTGGSQPFNNMQPYTTVNFVIALQGVFPSRG